MADVTKIEWTHRPGTKGCTWNPIRAENTETGKLGWYCEHDSHACDFCYAENRNCNTFFGNGLPYKPKTPVRVFLDERTLLQPLHWRAPRTIFVCSMTDIFGRWVKDEWLDKIFAIAALCPQHVFIILTKRPERMQHYVRYLCNRDDLVADEALALIGRPKNAHPDSTAEKRLQIMVKVRDPGHPLPNVWLGVTAEDRPNANERVRVLLRTPAAVRFVSVEPMLGQVDIRQWNYAYGCPCGWGGDEPHSYCEACGRKGQEAFEGEKCPGCGELIGEHQACPECGQTCCEGSDFGPNSTPRLDWVICGGETGKSARPMHPNWARSLRDQCAAANVPLFFKQNGEWAPGEIVGPNTRTIPCATWFDERWLFETAPPARLDDHIDDEPTVFRCGKRHAGRLLDGVEHSEFPEIAP